MDTRIRGKLLHTNVLFMGFVFMMWTFIVAECNRSIHNSLYHNRYTETIDRRQFHPSLFRPTSASEHLINSHPISSPNRHPPSPTKHYYKSLRPPDIRRNDNHSDIFLPKREMISPHLNPWLTLYRPSSVPPSHPHRTKKPIELSWKPSHMVLDEVPKIPSSANLQELRHQLPRKDYYKHLYGTPEGMKYLKTNYGPESLPEVKAKLGLTQDLEDVRLANEHFLRMRSSGRCKVPSPEVVCVKDLYPNSSKEYLPRCTLLHRCGDRSGCCDSEALKCVPRAIQEVALNFYVVHIGLPTSHVGLENSVEKLLFTNHTDCECVPNPLTTTSSTTTTTTTTTAVPSKRLQISTTVAPPMQPRDPTPPDIDQNLPLQDNHDELRLNVIDHEEDDDEDLDQSQTKSKCRGCPLPFSLRKYPDGRCGCDCFDKHKPCLRVKRGREVLENHEKRCVESSACNIPDCEYGDYIISTGRCPKKPDDFQKPTKNLNNPRSLHNPNHRWIYFERD